MTIPADTRPEDSGKAITPASETAGLDPFVATETDAATAPRGLRARMLDYSAHAAMIVGLVGFAWTVGDHVVHRQTASADAPAKIASTKAVTATPSDPIGELRDRNRELSTTVHTLQARLDALQASVGDQGKVAAQVRVLQAGLDNVKTSLGTARGEQSAALARLDGKIDKLGHAPSSKTPVDRQGRLGTVDTTPTASLPRPDAEARVSDAKAADSKAADSRPVVIPVPRPAHLEGADKASDTKLANAEDSAKEPAKEQAKPPVLTNWVVRDVYQGVALLEGRRGTIEVVPGVALPGAGVVKSIERHGGGWTVITTKGVVAYAPPPRETRRADRGGYGYGNGYRYDF